MTVPRVLSAVLLLALVFTGSAAGAGVRLSSRDEPLVSGRALAAGERVLAPRAAPFRFNLVGLHWRGRGAVSFRTRSVSGRWSAWRPARPEAEDLPDRATDEARARRGWKLGNPYWTGAARHIQYRVSSRVVRLRAHFVASAVRPLARRPAAAPMPRIVTRAAWGADESIVRDAPSYADRLAFAVVHHTAGTKPSSPAQSAAVVRGIQAYHVKSNGWDDIGYNFLVDPFGQIFEGRAGGLDRNVIGAHAQGFNTGSVGAAVLGSYGSEAIPAGAKEALVSLLAWRLDVGHVDPVSRITWISRGNPRFSEGTPVTLDAVSGHRDTGYTSCPGALLYGELGDIAAQTAARGLPKLYDPRVDGRLGGPIRFTARLSAPLAWTVTVLDARGGTVARGAGNGSRVDWTWDATGTTDGRYSYVIEAGPSVRPARGALGLSAPLALSGLATRPAVVTPNGDGLTDRTKVSFTVTVPASVLAWLEDEFGTRVTTVLPARAVAGGTVAVWWNGTTHTGEPVADGRYRLVVEASAGGDRVSSAVDVVVDRTLGRLRARPAAFSPNGDGRLDTLALRFDLAREAGVRVRVLAGARTVATLATGAAAPAGRQSVVWNGRTAWGTVARDGRYRTAVEATTALGTRRLVADVVLDTRRPRISNVSARRRGRGTLVRFTLSEPGRLALRLGQRTFVAYRRAGRASLWWPARAGFATVVVSDAAGNASRPASARVRG